jgi:serine/threonine protein phosphatase PrpC
LYCSDHKPNVRKEQERIKKAGGHITQVGDDVLRVESNLAMTRVLGDFSLDKNVVPALADIVQHQRDASTAFVVIACDGIWDVMSNEQVATFVAHRVSNTSLENIASQLLDQCLHKESTDNMTVYIVKLY